MLKKNTRLLHLHLIFCFAHRWLPLVMKMAKFLIRIRGVIVNCLHIWSMAISHSGKKEVEISTLPTQTPPYIHNWSNCIPLVAKAGMKIQFWWLKWKESCDLKNRKFFSIQGLTPSLK